MDSARPATQSRISLIRNAPIRLLYPAGSPFARLVRIALLETGLDALVTKEELTRTRLYSPESDVLVLNPVGRVPTLELDDGTILTASKLILDYIDALNPGPKLLPRDGSDGWRTLAEAGQALGLLEGVVTWLRLGLLLPPEPQRAVDVIARESEQVNRAADSLESAVARGAYAAPLNEAQIVLGTALGLVEPRLPVWKWREGRPSLANWYDAMAARASFRMTETSAIIVGWVSTALRKALYWYNRFRLSAADPTRASLRRECANVANGHERQFKPVCGLARSRPIPAFRGAMELHDQSAEIRTMARDTA